MVCNLGDYTLETKDIRNRCEGVLQVISMPQVNLYSADISQYSHHLKRSPI